MRKGTLHTERTKRKMRGRRGPRPLPTEALFGNNNARKTNLVIVPPGYSRHPLYGTYYRMVSQCYNAKDHSYRYFGLKGVTVCDRWMGANGFLNFIEDVKEKPIELNERGQNVYTFSIRDPAAGYNPQNYHWRRWIQ